MRDDQKTPLKMAIVEKPTINVIYILDSSNSMNDRKNMMFSQSIFTESISNPSKYENAIKGMIDEIQVLQQDSTANYTYTLVEFGDHTMIVTQFYKESVAPVSKLNSLINFKSWTALNDAVGFTLNKLRQDYKSNEKILVSILTDGEENGSRVYSASQIKDLIKQCEALGFTITFIGTERDVKTATKDYGIHASNTFAYDGSAEGLKKGSMTRSANTLSYAKKLVNGDDVSLGFFSQEQEGK